MTFISKFVEMKSGLFNFPFNLFQNTKKCIERDKINLILFEYFCYLIMLAAKCARIFRKIFFIFEINLT